MSCSASDGDLSRFCCTPVSKFKVSNSNSREHVASGVAKRPQRRERHGQTRERQALKIFVDVINTASSSITESTEILSASRTPTKAQRSSKVFSFNSKPTNRQNICPEQNGTPKATTQYCRRCLMYARGPALLQRAQARVAQPRWSSTPR